MSALYSTTFTSGAVPNRVREFVVDKESDLSSIDISQILAGSRAFVIEDSNWFMLNNKWKWV